MKQHTNQIKKLLSAAGSPALPVNRSLCVFRRGSGSGGGGDASGSGASGRAGRREKVLKLAHLFAESSEGTDVMMSGPVPVDGCRQGKI